MVGGKCGGGCSDNYYMDCLPSSNVKILLEVFLINKTVFKLFTFVGIFNLPVK